MFMVFFFYLFIYLFFSEGQASGSGMISSTLPSLAMYASNDDDPYITLKDDEVCIVCVGQNQFFVLSCFRLED